LAENVVGAFIIFFVVLVFFAFLVFLVTRSTKMAVANQTKEKKRQHTHKRTIFFILLRGRGFPFFLETNRSRSSSFQGDFIIGFDGWCCNKALFALEVVLLGCFFIYKKRTNKRTSLRG